MSHFLGFGSCCYPWHWRFKLKALGVTSVWKPLNSDPTATGAGGTWVWVVLVVSAVGDTLAVSHHWVSCSSTVVQPHTNPKGVGTIPTRAGLLWDGIKGKEWHMESWRWNTKGAWEESSDSHNCSWVFLWSWKGKNNIWSYLVMTELPFFSLCFGSSEYPHKFISSWGVCSEPFSGFLQLLGRV